jgi:hypothetical protein
MANLGLRVREVTVFDENRSSFTMAIFTPESLRWLQQHGTEMVYLDATFSTSEHSMLLHVLGVQHGLSEFYWLICLLFSFFLPFFLSDFLTVVSGGEFLPCVFFLTDSKEETVYRRMLSLLREVREKERKTAHQKRAFRSVLLMSPISLLLFLVLSLFLSFSFFSLFRS